MPWYLRPPYFLLARCQVALVGWHAGCLVPREERQDLCPFVMESSVRLPASCIPNPLPGSEAHVLITNLGICFSAHRIATSIAGYWKVLARLFTRDVHLTASVSCLNHLTAIEPHRNLVNDSVCLVWQGHEREHECGQQEQNTDHAYTWKCMFPGCDHFFVSERNLSDHIRMLHPECEFCNKGCDSIKKLRKHIVKRHVKTGEAVECVDCKRFVSKQ